MHDHQVMKSTQGLQVRNCCGCGIIQVSFGAVMLRVSKDAFLEMAAELGRIADNLQEPSGSVEAVFAPVGGRKYIA